MNKKTWLLSVAGFMAGGYFLFRDRPEKIAYKESLLTDENQFPLSSKQTKYFLVTEDALPLSLTIVAPTYRPIKAVVQVIHGILEHSGRYLELADYLAGQGYVVVLSDLRGHGHSIDQNNPLGQMPGVNRMLLDQLEITKFVKKQYPEKPLYLYGHSFGAILARLFLAEHDDKIDKLLLTGTPVYQPAAKLGHILATIAIKTTGKDSYSWIMKKLSGFGSEDKSWLTNDKEKLAQAINDPLIIPGYNNIGVATIWEADRRLKNYADYHCQNPELAILSITGQEDQMITGGEKGLLDTEQTLRKIGYHDIQIMDLPTMKHEVIQEVDRATVYKMIDQFFEK